MFDCFENNKTLLTSSSEDTCTPDFSNISKLNRSIRKQNIPIELENNYRNALKAYKHYVYSTSVMQQSYSLTYFDIPLNFFKMAGNNLIFTRDSNLNFINIANAFQKLDLPQSPNNQLEKRLINSLKRYLNHSIPLYHRAFYRYLFSIQTKNIELSNDSVIPFYKPYENFFTIDGTFFTKFHNNGQLLCITSSNIYSLFKEQWKIPFPKDSKLLNQLLRECKKDYVSPSFSQQAPENPYHLMVQDKVNNNYFDFKYCAESKDFIVSIVESESLLFLKECNFICTKAIALPKLTTTVAKFLFTITKGNIKLLNSWATLFANIASPEYFTKKIFIINCADCYRDFLIYMLDLIFYNIKSDSKLIMPFDNLKEIITPASIPTLCSAQASGKKYFIIEKIQKLYNDEEIKSMKKMIVGRPIYYKDDLLGRISYINNIPIICVVHTHEDLTYLKNNFSYMEIPFWGKEMPKNNTDNFTDVTDNDINEFDSIDDDFFEWLRIKLPLYGLQSLRMPTEELKGYSYRKVVKQDYILNEFVGLCCKVKKDTSSFTTAEDLYQAYLYFYEHLYPGDALGKRQIIKVLKQCGTFEYKRPHISRTGSNPYAFMGLELKENFKDLIDEKVDPAFSSPDMKSFYDNLAEIDNSVTVNYDNLPKLISTTTPNIYAEHY